MKTALYCEWFFFCFHFSVALLPSMYVRLVRAHIFHTHRIYFSTNEMHCSLVLAMELCSSSKHKSSFVLISFSFFSYFCLTFCSHLLIQKQARGAAGGRKKNWITAQNNLLTRFISNCMRLYAGCCCWIMLLLRTTAIIVLVWLRNILRYLFFFASFS